MGNKGPLINAPKCPKCGDPLGTPADIECGVEPGRWDGPPEATLFCPACGVGWIGTDDDLAIAWASWSAYEVEMGAPACGDVLVRAQVDDEVCLLALGHRGRHFGPSGDEWSEDAEERHAR